MRTRSISIFAALSTLVACGGSAPASKAPAPSSSASSQTDPSIGDAAVAQGGIAALENEGIQPTGAEAAMTGPLSAITVADNAPVKLDGLLKEWPARTRAKTWITGGKEKLSFATAIQYDADNVYVAGEVSDSQFVRTSRFGDDEDRASLVLAFPAAGGLSAYEIGLYAGKPGEIAGAVKYAQGASKGQDVQGAKIVEAPTAGGYSFEAKIPWSTFPESRTLRVGLRGAVRYYDSAHGSIAHVLATGPGDASQPKSLPAIPTESEQAVVDGLLQQKGLAHEVPRIDLYADVAGDKMLERISVFGKYFTICGPGYRDGRQFFFRELNSELLGLEAKDVTGRGKADLLVRSRFTPTGKKGDKFATREDFEVWTLVGGDEPVTTFAQEIAIADDTHRVTNALRLSKGRIDVTTQPASGWDATTYNEATTDGIEPIIVPWGDVRSRSYRYDGSHFTKALEVPQTPTGPARVATTASVAPQPAQPLPRDLPTPTVKTQTDLSRELLDQYKRDQSVPASVTPKVNLEVQVAEDARPERAVLIGKDIVVFGPGFKGGNQYTFITLSAFDSADDIRDMTARDLTGEGNADLVVRGERHVTAQGAPTKVDLDVILVYAVKDGKLVRIFAIETGRSEGNKRVQGMVQFIPHAGGQGFDVDVRPGIARGWNEHTYPWRQDQPGGSMEPLLLPWGGISSLKYTYDGTQFSRAQ